MARAAREKPSLFQDPITSYRVANFKAAHDAKVVLPGLTLLLGGNSSGKSSVFQSINTLTHNLGLTVPDEFSFLSPSFKGGKFSDIVSEGFDEIRYELEFGRDVLSLSVSRSPLENAFEERDFQGQLPHKMLGMESSVRAGVSHINAISRTNSPKVDFSIRRDDELSMRWWDCVGTSEFSHNASEERWAIERFTASGKHNFHSDVCAHKSPHAIRGEIMLEYVENKSVFSLPRMAPKFDLEHYVLERLVDHATQINISVDLFDFLPEDYDDASDALFNSHRHGDQLAKEALELIREGLRKFKETEFSDTYNSRNSKKLDKHLSSIFSQANPDGLHVLLCQWPNGQVDFKGLSEDYATYLGYTSENDECWAVFAEAFNAGLSRVASAFNYLGPLRSGSDDVQYASPSFIRNSPVGIKGENALYEYSRWRFLNTISSNRFPDASGKLSMDLHQAVQSWLSFFGVSALRGASIKPGKQPVIRVSDAGISGLRGTVDGVDFINLGAGVAQLFPVIVGCLKTKPGEVFLVEQPELHLHPSAQRLLADFLIAMAESGRKLLVETHSEYLVTRLRRLIAVDKKNPELVNLIFVEPYGQQEDSYQSIHGRSLFGSKYFSVKMTETGQFNSWPLGFFDQVEQDLLAILEEDISRSN